MAGEDHAVAYGFEDFLPAMAARLGPEGLVRELCKGFRLLMDTSRGAITLESLKRNATRLGLQGMGDEELEGMVREGDLDGDGALDQMEFCVLMVRLSPELMKTMMKLGGGGGSSTLEEHGIELELRSLGI